MLSNINHVIHHILTQLSIKKIIVMSSLVFAVFMCKGRRISLSSIARTVPRNISFKHKFKVIDRFLSNQSVVIEYLSLELLRFLVARCDKKSLLSIVVDWTKEAGKQVLNFALANSQRAIPFYWVCVETAEIAKSQNSIENTALQLLKSWTQYLGITDRVVILADRGFMRSDLIRYLSSLGFKYVIRVPRSVHVYTGKTAIKLNDMGLKRGECKNFAKVLYTSERKIQTRLVMTYGYKCKEEWFLITNIKDVTAKKIIQLYKLRSKIESAHRDLKTPLGWRGIRIKSNERLRRFILLNVLVMIVAMLIADNKNNSSKILKISQIWNKRSNKALSYLMLAIFFVNNFQKVKIIIPARISRTIKELQHVG